MDIDEKDLTIYLENVQNIPSKQIMDFLRFGHERDYWRVESGSKANLISLTITPLPPLKKEVDFCIDIPYDGTLENLLENIHQCYFDLKIEDLISNWIGLVNIKELNITINDIVKNARYCKSRILLCYTEMMVYYKSL